MPIFAASINQTNNHEMSAAQLVEVATKKGYSITRVKSGIYQYSTNGYEWTNVTCNYSQFCKIIKAL